jgi:hypothetical protein
MKNFDVLLTVHLSIFISVINQLDAQNFCFTTSLFNASKCFENMCLKHVEAWNKLTVKQKFCASSWLITEIKKKHEKLSKQLNNTVFSKLRLNRTVGSHLKLSNTVNLTSILFEANTTHNKNYMNTIETHRLPIK